MSEQRRDEDELEAFLAGGSELSRRYKESSGEQPPAHVDAAILAASRWAVGADNKRAAKSRIAPAQRRRLVQWSVPLAMAAVVVLAVTLTLTIERDPELDRIYQRHDAPVAETRDSEKEKEQEKEQEPAAVAVAPAVSEEKPALETKKIAVSAPRKAIEPQAPAEQKSPATTATELAGRATPPPGAVVGDSDAGKVEADASALMADMASPQPLPEERAAPSLAKRQRSDDTASAVGSVAQTEGVPPPASQSENLAADPADTEPLVVEELAPEREVVAFDEQEAASRIAAEPEYSGAPPEQAALAPSPPQRDPAQWLADIEEQLDQGNVELARAAIKKFRSRYPDYELPERLAELLPEPINSPLLPFQE